MTCPVCSGVGLVPGKKPHPLMPGFLVTTSGRCALCQGTGKVEAEPPLFRQQQGASE
jgi:hypothetical protein